MRPRDPAPTCHRPRPGLVEDALVLRRRHGPASGHGNRRPATSGITWRQVAAELGVSCTALEKARERAGWPDA